MTQLYYCAAKVVMALLFALLIVVSLRPRPGFLRDLAPWLPPYHLAQLALKPSAATWGSRQPSTGRPWPR